ncbi:MAG: sulfite exporter TauE/SafE family protein [Cyclobacteriaceae bacterium]|nr:sulfite exporter TauE/SafE family protein [Cyclobacteriaceae bacterium]
MLWSAFLMGFLGSFHCIGMCGPIVLALPGKSVAYKVLYNLGRTITYTLMGIVVGMVGQGFSMVGWQQWLSIGVGALMLIIILFTKYKHFDLPMSGAINALYQKVKSALGPLLRSESSLAPLLIGILNGLLPCGLVYAALFAALSMGGVSASAYYMALFGLGTIPIMLGLGLFSTIITPAVRTKLNRAVPYFLAVVAILLILRGMNLGIPLVSPKMDGSGHMHMNHKM